MGLDASIMCNCYAEGRTTPPPLPTDFICIDAEDRLILDLPYDEENRDKHDLFYNWSKNCCEHQHMNYVYEQISNWGDTSAE